MSVLAKLRPGDANDRAGHGEAQALIPAGLGEDVGVDANQLTSDVDERAAAVARIDRGVGLNEDHGVVVIGLSGDGADHAHRHRVAKAFRTAESQDDFSLAQRVVLGQRDGGKASGLDLQEREVHFLSGANDFRVEDPAAPADERVDGSVVSCGRRQGDLDLDGSRDDVGVGHDVAVRVDDDTRAETELTAEHEVGVIVTVALKRAVSRHGDLDDARRHALNEFFDRVTEECEGIRFLGG